jgi:hypothetical protein
MLRRLLIALAARLLRAAGAPAPPRPRQTVDVPREQVQQLIDDCEPLFEGIALHDMPLETLETLGFCAELQKRIREDEWRDVERLLAAEGLDSWVAAGPKHTHPFPADVGSRCSVCAVDWPPTAAYAYCPLCEEPTSVAYGLSPLSESEAWQVVEEREQARSRAAWERLYNSPQARYLRSLPPGALKRAIEEAHTHRLDPALVERIRERAREGFDDMNDEELNG